MDNPVLKIKQTGSPIRRHHRQRATLIGLGLNRMGRTVQLPGTPEIRGMIAKIQHLVRVSEIKPLSRRRFDALAGYARHPRMVFILEELEWFATQGDRLVGLIGRDRYDNDFSWVLLGRDERLRFRAVAVNASLPTVDAARQQLMNRMWEEHDKPDREFHQGDAPGKPMDFFTRIVPATKLSPTFKILTEAPRYSPARELVEAMMHSYEDADGNFVEQFQTTAFNARFWELYLFATFIELGYATTEQLAVPDYIFSSHLGSIGIEATTVNPAAGANVEPPKEEKELIAYMENYVPIKLSNVLKRKLGRTPHYWDLPEMKGIPFVIAVQDFHLAGSMMMIVSAMTEYAFGVRHSMEADSQTIEWIDEHVWKGRREKSGFFKLPGAENVSAIIVNPQGTLPKFNRMGYLAEFGDRRIQMKRTGFSRGERNGNPTPTPFEHMVHAAGYSESWVEGMVVLHNPTASIPLDPNLIPGASHEFLQSDGKIMSLIPEFHPLFSMTEIRLVVQATK